MYVEKALQQLHKNIANYTEQVLEAKQQLYGYLPSSRKLSKLDEPDMWDTAGEVRTNSLVTYSRGPLHIDKQRQDDQIEPIYNSSVLIQDRALKTSRGQWTIETGGERESGRSVLQRDIMMMMMMMMKYRILVLISLLSRCPRGVMVKPLNCRIVVSEFEL